MKLVDYLAKEGLNPSKFAAILRVPSSTVSRILQGKRRPSWAIVEKISAATNGSVCRPEDFAVELPEGTLAPSERREKTRQNGAAA